jgi:glycosyltransferase involved in cell wall biosynthesis
MVEPFPQKIIHVELSGVVSDLIPDNGYSMFYIVFWWHHIPLGHTEVRGNELPMSGHQLKQLGVKIIAPAIAAHLQEFDLPVPDVAHIIAQNNFAADEILQQWEVPFANWQKQQSLFTKPSISVVICTRDRPQHLKKCLQSIQNLAHPPDEILVVDNAPSSDATQKLVAQMPGIKYVLERQPGLDFARNAGIHHSICELIAYTDDDVIIHPDWILHLQQAFQNPNVMAVTGLVLAAEINTRSQYIFETYWSFNRGYCPVLYDYQYFQKYQLLGVPTWRIGAGANMAFRRSSFKITGDFDERLDVGAAGCSGDSEMWYRVLAKGFVCRYQPTAVVYHIHRSEMAALHKQLFNYMRGHVTELLIRFERYRHFGNLVRLALLPVYFSYLLVFGLRYGKWRYSTLLTEMSGCLSGFRFYFKSTA